MPWFSYLAIFFVIWWIVLFAVLPFGMRSQSEDSNVVAGTERGAPVRVSVIRKLLVTTFVTACVFGIYYVVTAVFGYSFDDIPSLIPKA